MIVINWTEWLEMKLLHWSMSQYKGSFLYTYKRVNCVFDFKQQLSTPGNQENEHRTLLFQPEISTFIDDLTTGYWKGFAQTGCVLESRSLTIN